MLGWTDLTGPVLGSLKQGHLYLKQLKARQARIGTGSDDHDGRVLQLWLAGGEGSIRASVQGIKSGL